MNEGIHLDLDTWIVPGQIRKANLCRGLGNRYTPAGTEGIPLLIIIIIEGLSLLQSIPPTTANKQTQAQKRRGSRARKLLGAKAKSKLQAKKTKVGW